MPPRTYATADIGSNTVHLLIAQTDGKAVIRLDNQSHWLGLGEAVAETGEIDKPKARELVEALESFKKLAASRKADATYVFATEAVRKAKNHKEVLTFVENKAGIGVHVITPERETQLAVRGAMLDSFGEMPTAFFDIGGGSAQVARIESSGVTKMRSMSLGTGTLRVRARLEDAATPESIERLDTLIADSLGDCGSLGPVRRVVGGGGVARGVLRALHADRDRLIERYEIEYLERTAMKLSTNLLAKRFRVGATRARTLLPGVMLTRRLLDLFAADHVLISEFGIREGAVLELAEGRIEATA